MSTRSAFRARQQAPHKVTPAVVVGVNSTHNSSFQLYPLSRPPFILSQQGLLSTKLSTTGTDRSVSTHALLSECGRQNFLEIQRAQSGRRDPRRRISACIWYDSVTAY